MGEEVPRPRWPALGPFAFPVGGGPWLLGPMSQQLSCMDNLNSSQGPREVASQALEDPTTGCAVPPAAAGSSPRSIGVLDYSPPPTGDVLMLPNVSPSLTYRGIHLALLSFGTVLWIKLVFDESTRANTCYIFFHFRRG